MSAARPVTRGELLDYQTYSDRRPAVREHILAVKARRRVDLGPHLTLLFENRDTVRYQVQEMMRVERIVREDAIRRELETYNELLGGEGELGATLLIALPERAQLDLRLVEWRDLPGRVYTRFEDGSRAYASFDQRQVAAGRIAAVQFLKFPCGGQTPVAVGTDFPPLATEAELTPEQRAALAADLQGC